MLSPSGSTILKKAMLPSPPVKVVANGLLDVDYRILAACRDGKVYTLRNLDSVAVGSMSVRVCFVSHGTSRGLRLTCLLGPVAGVRREDRIGFPCGGDGKRVEDCCGWLHEPQRPLLPHQGQEAVVHVHAWCVPGPRALALAPHFALLCTYTPAARLRCTPCTCADDIVCMEKMEVAMVSIVRAVVIALKGGEVRVYNEKQLVIKIPPRNKASPDPVMGTWPSPLRLPPHLLVHVRMAR